MAGGSRLGMQCGEAWVAVMGMLGPAGLAAGQDSGTCSGLRGASPPHPSQSWVREALKQDAQSIRI